MGIGIDLVLISRFNNKEKIAKKVLSEIELKGYYLVDDNQKAQYLAGKFALKEAFLKANEKGILELDLKEIQVLKKENGAPYIEYKGKTFECSLSHDGDYCVGVVIL